MFVRICVAHTLVSHALTICVSGPGRRTVPEPVAGARLPRPQRSQSQDV